MSHNLCDETFPSSLLLEFDELDDDIPITPELPPRRSQKTRRILDSAGHPEVEQPPSRSCSNTSSGNSSLSTENRSESSSASDATKTKSALPGTGDRLASRPRDYTKKPQPAFKTVAGSQKRAVSLENLLHDDQLNGASDASGPSGGQRNRHKFGHVQSKVKLLIREMKQADRERTLVRHKSMPETYKPTKDDTLSEAFAVEMNVEELRNALRETQQQVNELQQQLAFKDLHRKEAFDEITSLQWKMHALRTENDRLLQVERMRTELQQQQLLVRPSSEGPTRYGSQSSLNKVLSTVGTQTSPPAPVANVSVVAPGAPGSASRTIVKVKRALYYAQRNRDERLDDNSLTVSRSPMLGEFSPDYEQLIPALGRTVNTLPLADPTGSTGQQHHPLQNQHAADPCAKCRKHKKLKTKRERFASLFCIRKNEESL